MVTNGDLPAVITVDFESFYVQTGRRMLSLAYAPRTDEQITEYPVQPEIP